MKINNIDIINEKQDKSQREIIKQIKIPKNKKGIFLFGENQTGKTTFIYHLHGIFGFQLKYLRKALDIEDNKTKLFKISVSHPGFENITYLREFKEDFYKSDNNYVENRASYSQYITIRNEVKNEGEKNSFHNTFLENYFDFEKIEHPKILNINSLNSIDINNNGSYWGEIEITDYSRLFIHSQNPEIILGSHAYSNAASLLFTLISLTTSEFDNQITEFADGYLARESNTLTSKIHKQLKAGINDLGEKDKRALQLLLHRDSSLTKFDKEKSKLVNRISQILSEIDSIDKKIYSRKITKEQFSNDRNLNFMVEGLEDYYKTILLNNILFQDEEDLTEIKELEKRKKELKATFKELNRELKTNYENSFTNFEKTINNKNILEVFESKYLIDKTNELNKSIDKFPVTTIIKKIENDFFNKYISKTIINEIINEIQDKIPQSFKESKSYTHDIEGFKELVNSNFKLFDVIYDNDSYRPQGAMNDIYSLLKILLYVKAIEKNGRKIPFVIIDTPYRNENLEFYKAVPNIIMNMIVDSKAVENAFISTAKKIDDNEINNFPSLLKVKTSKNESEFNLEEIE